MAKLNRERKLIEKRHAKQIKKDARRQAAADGTSPDELAADDTPTEDETPAAEQPRPPQTVRAIG
jgi:hypothetical protein